MSFTGHALGYSTRSPSSPNRFLFLLIVSYSRPRGCSAKVYHKRREQSVDVLSGANNHFELDFEVRATFDRDMEDLTAAGLRVQRLVCAPTMQLEMRIQLESRILGDLIIL